MEPGQPVEFEAQILELLVLREAQHRQIARRRVYDELCGRARRLVVAIAEVVDRRDQMEALPVAEGDQPALERVERFQDATARLFAPECGTLIGGHQTTVSFSHPRESHLRVTPMMPEFGCRHSLITSSLP